MGSWQFMHRTAATRCVSYPAVVIILWPRANKNEYRDGIRVV